MGRQSTGKSGVCSVNVLVRMLLEPELQQPFEDSAALPVKYEKILNGDFPRHGYLQDMEKSYHQGRIYHSRLHTDFGAPVARYRDGNTSVTLITETPSFLHSVTVPSGCLQSNWLLIFIRDMYRCRK